MSSGAWQEVFESLPDQGFFEAVRHYLGPVATPFHKPDLINRMAAFFSDQEAASRALEYVDPIEAKYLTLIAFRDGITEQQLIGMLPEEPYIDFRLKLLNLQERFLVYRRKEGKTRRYSLTPLGRMVEDSGYLGPGAIIGSGKAVEPAETMAWFDDVFLTAALAFLNEGMILFKKEGGWRKKSLEAAEERFPRLFSDSKGPDRLIMAGRGLIASGLAERRDETLVPKQVAWREMESRSTSDRISMLKTRAAVGRSVPVENAISAIKLLTDHLPLERSYAADDLAILFQLAVGPTAPSPAGARRVIAHLELMGELNACDDGRLRRTPPAPSAPPMLSVGASGDITLRPGAPLFCDLALSTKAGALDIVAGFTMDKDCFQTGIDHGMNPESFLEKLVEYSGHPLPGNLVTLASEWAKDHKEMDLKAAVVLTARGLKGQILAETGVLDAIAYAKPAEGVWILDPAEEDKWRGALADVGMDNLPTLRTPSGESMANRPLSSSTVSSPLLSWKGGIENPPLAHASWEAPKKNDTTPIFSSLEEAGKKAGLTSQEEEVFQERLERKLILHPKQIRKGAWRYEVMTAKGLDYRGKIRLAEAAISGGDDRLSVNIASGLDIETILILPKGVEKDGDDHVLVGLQLPQEEEVRFRIRKIGFLRRIKTSIF